MLRLLFIGILASIYIIHIQAEKSVNDVVNDKLKTLATRKSDTLEDRLSVLKNSNNALTLWNTYKEYNKKTYKTPEEDKQRMGYFIDNMKKIITANYNYEKGLQTYKFEVNDFVDIDEKEFLATYTGLKQDTSEIHNEDIKIPDVKPLVPDYRRKKRSLTFPDSLDYRPQMNPAEHQHECGSCYAFATVGAVEGAYAVKKNYKMNLSKQQIIDCTMNYACKGGFPAVTLNYIKGQGGLHLTSSYPYKNDNGTCHAKKARFGYIRGYGQITSFDEEDMKIHLNLYGPLVVGVDATDLQLLASEPFMIFDSPKCTQKLGHAVLIVGYGTANGKDYWLVRNSWGTKWCDHGHFRIARNKGMCGINLQVHYVLL